MKQFLIGLLFTGVVFGFITSTPVSAQVRDWEVIDPLTKKVDQSKSCTVDGVPTLQCLEVVYDNILFLASSLVLLVLFAMLVYGGVLFITAFGSSEKIEQAQNTLKWALIGIGLFAASYLILFIIDQAFLGGAGKIFELHIPGPSTTP